MLGVDVGAGTVDVTSVQVVEIEPFLRLGEVIPPCGSLLGSQRLNEIFLRLLQDHYPEEIQSVAEYGRVLQSDLLDSISEAFDKVKANFDSKVKKHTLRLECRRSAQALQHAQRLLEGQGFMYAFEIPRYVNLNIATGTAMLTNFWGTRCRSFEHEKGPRRSLRLLRSILSRPRM